MIDVDEARARILALASPLPAISRPLAGSVGHFLAEKVVAKRSQPAANLSSMDGFAIRFSDLPGPWRVVGESAAGRPFGGQIGAGETVRIFTGAHVPVGADCIVIQEDAVRQQEKLTLTGDGPSAVGANIRRMGGDFAAGECLLEPGTRLSAGAVGVAAMAGYGSLWVGGRPRIRIIASGDELRSPGEPCDDAHIPSSNSVMLAAMLGGLPCEVDDAGIVADKLPELEAALVRGAQSDIIVTSGGASVGDHDLMQAALRNVGAEMDFWKVAMRPGKPVMAGRLGNTVVLGLPGNPASAFVTAFLFLLPLVRHLAGSRSPLPQVETALLTMDLPEGGQRADYLRATVDNGRITEIYGLDSGIVVPLAKANALVIRPAGSPKRTAGSSTQYLPIN